MSIIKIDEAFGAYQIGADSLKGAVEKFKEIQAEGQYLLRQDQVERMGDLYLNAISALTILEDYSKHYLNLIQQNNGHTKDQ